MILEVDCFSMNVTNCGARVHLEIDNPTISPQTEIKELAAALIEADHENVLAAICADTEFYGIIKTMIESDVERDA